MSIDFINLTAKISTLLPEAAKRRSVVAVAVAQLLAEEASLPVSRVEAIENYFNMNIQTTIFKKMGMLNEQLNFDPDLAKELTRKFWMLRYNTLFPISPAKRKQDTTCGYFPTIMGVGEFIDPETNQLVNQYCNEILEIYVDLEYQLKGE